jgi:uncharacterized protein YceH (UPF0502 family)
MVGIFRRDKVMAKKKTRVPEKESKNQKFIRVFAPKMNKAIRAIRLLANGAGAAYESKDKDVEGMIAALRQEVDVLEQRYTSGEATPSGFQFGKAK